MSVAESWRRITHWHDANVGPGWFHLHPGASPSALADLERQTGLDLPEDLRESLRLHNGGTAWILWHGAPLSTEGILYNWQIWARDAVDGVIDWPATQAAGPIRPYFWTTQRLHIVGECQHLTVDLDPAPGGAVGQILSHCHEVGPEKVLANSWSEFLDQLATDLESGKYVYSQLEDTVALPGMYD